ncbi:MAG: N-acetyl-gamma-glutamyl-phosphate reductase [Alphaproteobacteria bacterium]
MPCDEDDFMTKVVFLDGASGATGVEMGSRLGERDGLRVLRLEADERRDIDARRRALDRCDLAILCLPDEVSRKMASLAEEANVRVIDASSAHRTDADWIYGFPEMVVQQRERIRTARRVSNPGCYATGGIGLLRPMSEAGLLSLEWTPIFQAVSGYSGGGRDLIHAFEEQGGGNTETNFYLYGLNLKHKHLPEVYVHSGHALRPMILPSVGRFRRGMLVALPLPPAAWRNEVPSTAHLVETFRAHYGDESFVEVATTDLSRLDPEALNGTNTLRIHIIGEEAEQTRLLVACLDNLGKGACGAAVQNMNLMLGFEETLGLL